MPPPLKLANTLKVAELKFLALACGIPSSGAKASLIQRIDAAIHETTEQRASPLSEQRILSIDMGIRNLAFSLLTPPSDITKVLGQGVRTPVPGFALQSWNRVELAGPASAVKPDRGEDLWSPRSMTEMTLDLVQNRFLNLKVPPTHILIERQRFRSGGGAAVQEWTLRVNTLEAMIYSTLRTMKACGRWEGEVIPIAPKRVGPFWVEGIAEEDDDTDTASKVPESKKNAKARHKKEKIDLVGKWLLEGKINPVDQAKDMAKSYLVRWQGKKRTKNTQPEEVGTASEHLKKLDDLADCLLQGMAWVKWQDNRRLLAKHGPAAILEAQSSQTDAIQ